MHRNEPAQFANPSFSALEGLPLDSWLAPELALITPGTALHQTYFPQRIPH
ncbi:hypothetical protein OG322_07935 [Streptomyces sp. NBC_01260]|uniref:hypothetical protein n=1 Tax=unclassified Streptomyces TaxID=2593676 RepID=UPI0013DE26A1|nr:MULTISPECIES: hypothetical protein [unclassified Streptomyces]MCX4769348.1 hypothetical protein [Streptomyces sp. NBC_01285]